MIDKQNEHWDTFAAVVEQAWADMQPKVDALRDWCRQWAASMQPVFEQILDGFRIAHRALRTHYDLVGQPYGPSDDDMYRWLVDQARAERAKEELREQVEYQAMLANLRMHAWEQRQL